MNWLVGTAIRRRSVATPQALKTLDNLQETQVRPHQLAFR